MNKKAFTLVEMLGVVVIIGLILLIVIPSISRVINNNDTEEMNNYYNLVMEASETYSAKLKSELGSSRYTGCAEITLDELIENGYIEKYNDKDTTCTTGSGNIKIRNNKGKISINFQMSCSKEGKDVLIRGNNDAAKCERYVLEAQDNLKITIESNPNIRKKDVENEVYIIGDNPDNYIWYSGKLWRVVSYNSLTQVVKAVTADSITSMYYNSNNMSTYANSDVNKWLNNDFLNSLKDNQEFIINNNWNATPNTSSTINPISPDKVIKSKVGLITSFDYGQIQDWYGNTKTWLISEGTNKNSLYTYNGITTQSSTSMLGVRPVISFNSTVQVYDGTGSINDPYIIDSTSYAVGKRGEYVNTRYSGEYVQIDDDIYRIVSNEGGVVKVIGTKKVGTYQYSSNNYNYSTSSLRTTLEKNLTKEYQISVTGDFCMDTINNTSLAYQSSKCINPSRVNSSIKIGIPKVGDFFTSSIKGVNESYWTLNPNTEYGSGGTASGATMNVISPTGSVDSSIISNQNAAVVVLYLNEMAKIQSGSGMSDDPYIIEFEYELYPDYENDSENTNKVQNAADKIISTDEADDNLIKHTTTLANSAKDNSYRYMGANPNNYVCFGSDAITCPEENLYRIIGVFGSNVKLVKSTALNNGESYYWNGRGSQYSGNTIAIDGTTYYNYWYYKDSSTGVETKATLNEQLNGSSYYGTLTSKWQNMIANHEWNIGGSSTSSVPATFYTEEQSTKWTGKIGLITPSEYGYAAARSYWTTNLNSYSSAATATDWLKLRSPEWTITRYSGVINGAFCVYSSGDVSDYFASMPTSVVRPSFYLNSNVLIYAGSGTKDNPYRLSM